MKIAFHALAALFFAAEAAAEYQFGFPEPASYIAREQHNLHLIILWIIGIIAVVVFGAMFYSIIYHRKSRGYKAANFHENTLMEMLWTAIPMVIIIGMAIPATITLLEARDTTAPDISVKVTGSQWRWHYDYLDQGVGFYSSLSTAPEEIGGLYYGVSDGEVPAPQSENYLLEVDNEMVVPVGKKVRLLLTAADVIHAWWVPQLGVKQDAIPGFVREAWFRADKPGVYRGQCAELCGKQHAYMPVVVRAVPEAEFASWLREQGAVAETGEKDVPALASSVPSAPAATPAVPKEMTPEDLAALGESAYGTHCAACHQPNGQGLPPAFPSLVGAPSVVGAKVDPLDIVLNGKQGTAMASFAYLSDEEIAAVINYERTSWGNQAEPVTPEEIAAAR